jgi:hypothetical protein
MLEQIKKEFSRYFFLTSKTRGTTASFGFGMFMRDNREVLSEIVPARLYLGNLPQKRPFSNQITIPEIKDAALVVSCMDIAELAESKLLLEPDAGKIKYHVLAMNDVSGETGNSDQVYDALQLMSEFAEAGKPIHIHCFSGVGRSAMMTAIHLAHRYLLKDSVICDLFDAVASKSNSELKVGNKDFIDRLYEVSCRYVSSVRRCCQFDNRERQAIAITALSRINSELNQAQLSGLPHNDHYAFIAELVQSPSFKRLHYEYYSYSNKTALYIDSSRDELSQKIPVNLQKNIKEFFDGLLLNKDEWFQQLTDTVTDNSMRVEHNLLDLFCTSQLPGIDSNEQALSVNARRELLVNLHNTINELAIKYPGALYSQSVVKVEDNTCSTTVDLNM